MSCSPPMTNTILVRYMYLNSRYNRRHPMTASKGNVIASGSRPSHPVRIVSTTISSKQCCSLQTICAPSGCIRMVRNLSSIVICRGLSLSDVSFLHFRSVRLHRFRRGRYQLLCFPQIAPAFPPSVPRLLSEGIRSSPLNRPVAFHVLTKSLPFPHVLRGEGSGLDRF